MAKQIVSAIAEADIYCFKGDNSCYAQRVSLKIESVLGKSWNVHVLSNETTIVKAKQYSHDMWISVVGSGGSSNLTYYIFKPLECSRPFMFAKNELSLSKNHLQKHGFKDLGYLERKNQISFG